MGIQSGFAIPLPNGWPKAGLFRCRNSATDLIISQIAPAEIQGESNQRSRAASAARALTCNGQVVIKGPQRQNVPVTRYLHADHPEAIGQNAREGWRSTGVAGNPGETATSSQSLTL
jgi:hypothetical protein